MDREAVRVTAATEFDTNRPVDLVVSALEEAVPDEV